MRSLIAMLGYWLFPKRPRSFRIFFAVMMAGFLLNGCGQHKSKVFRVGILCGLDGLITTVDGFKDKMTDLGYVEGKNITYDIHRTNFDPVAEEHILRRFVAEKVDMIFVFPSEVVARAKAVTHGTGIPVVFCYTNIEGTDLIKSVSEPGGNMTGVRFLGPDLALKRFEILHALAPRAKRMWVPYSAKSQVVPPQLAVLRPAAEKAGVALVEVPADTAEELLSNLKRRKAAHDIGIDAVLTISEPLAKTPEVSLKIRKFAFDHKIPIGGAPNFADSYPTVFGVTTNFITVGRLSAQQAHKVLRGIPVGTIPVVSAESYFQIDYKAAQQLGLNVPEGLLRQADEIIR
jgi:putative ABC transport system substrate-binding protein